MIVAECLCRKIPIFVIVAGLLAGCSNEIPGESRLPRCEPRSNTDPARLNIDSSAEDFAMSDPCRAAIQFYIASNTDLRAIEGEVDFKNIDGEDVAVESFRLEFTSVRGGMFSEVVELAPVDGHMCRQLLTNVSGMLCRDGKGDAIVCPAVRLKTGYVFEDFTIEARELNVCFD